MKFLDGKKTIIGQAALIVLFAFRDKMDPTWFTVLGSLSGLFTGVGLVHKVKKTAVKK